MKLRARQGLTMEQQNAPSALQAPVKHTREVGVCGPQAHLQLSQLGVHVNGGLEAVALLPLVVLRQLGARVAHLLQVVHANNAVREASCRRSTNIGHARVRVEQQIMRKEQSNTQRCMGAKMHVRDSVDGNFISARILYLRGAWCRGWL